MRALKPSLLQAMGAALNLRAIEAAIVAVGVLQAFWGANFASELWPWAVALFIAPIVEEIVFRGGAQHWLTQRGWRTWNANLVASLLFTAAHCIARGPSLLSLGVLFPSLLLGWVYGRTGSLRLCIGLHMIMNTTWLYTTSTWSL